jgi:hypothetical protein
MQHDASRRLSFDAIMAIVRSYQDFKKSLKTMT